MKDPYGEWSPAAGDRHLEIAFSYWEWESFFLYTLKAELTSYVEGEPYEQYAAREKSVFQDSLKEFPLLSRIHDFYLDAFFGTDEIAALETELKRIEKLSLIGDGEAFFRGMLLACKTARSESMGIRLLSS